MNIRSTSLVALFAASLTLAACQEEEEAPAEDTSGTQMEESGDTTGTTGGDTGSGTSTQ